MGKSFQGKLLRETFARETFGFIIKNNLKLKVSLSQGKLSRETFEKLLPISTSLNLFFSSGFFLAHRS